MSTGAGGPRRTWRLVAGAALVALVAGVGGGVVGAFIRPAPQGSASVRSADGGTCEVSHVAAHVLPSVVTITVAAGSGSGTGSGSVLDQQGNILTNDKLMAPAASRGTITVDFARGQSGVPATIVGRDPSTDLAVVRIQRNAGSLTPIQLGDSSELVVGQPVVAAGSPLGLTSTITSGIVSALSRYVNVGQGEQPATGVNSAGAQVPSAGAAGGGSIGLNFAIPIDFARSVAEQMIQKGTVTHPTIGVLGTTVTDEIARATGDPRGAFVDQVVPGLGAAAAGIRQGDVITRVSQSGVNSVDQMIVAGGGHQVGDAVDATYDRNRCRQN